MRVRQLLWLAAASLLQSPFAALAQDESTVRYCNVAFSKSISDDYSVFSDERRFNEYQQRLCDAKFESYQSFSSNGASLGVDVPLAEGMLGLSGSTESKSSTFKVKYAEFCSQTYYSSASYSRFKESSSKISQALVTGWNRCTELHLDAWVKARPGGIYLHVTPFDSFSGFIASFHQRSDENRKIVINNFTPEGSVDCRYAGKPVELGKTEIDLKKFNLTCSKAPYKEAPFSIDTNVGTTNVVMIPASSPEIQTLRSELRDLAATQSSHGTAISNLTSSAQSAAARISALEARKVTAVVFPAISGKKDQRQALGAHAVCMLAKTQTVHSIQACGCDVVGGPSNWALVMDLDEKVSGDCSCQAVCIDAW